MEHSPLDFIYDFFKPTAEINGQKYRLPWGTYLFPLEPGAYKVAVSYPWLFSAECGKNSVLFDLAQGETKKVRYRAGKVRYLPGSISVE